ncbi:MAG: heavy metal translocating P-type ATPase metal-binding domain-containing protein [Azospirillaceae bacterium]|nr:heavy metal translocating P-type ATPase metal-binding domain-containing protein [Azospirillaceae bacterium]
MEACLHCGQAVQPGARFCCPGCQAAFDLIAGLGLDQYYRRRRIDPEIRAIQPDQEAPLVDLTRHIRADRDGILRVHLMIDGLQCAACVWLIENVLSRQPDIVQARLNMTTRRLTLAWRGVPERGAELLAVISRLGYRAVPFDPERLSSQDAAAERELLRCLAVAGFGASNVMLLSVSVWAGYDGSMGEATRSLMHWLSALIGLPAIIFAARPFFRSAVSALAHRRTNMDVPISIGITLCSGMSLFETIWNGVYAYYDSALMLLFFLLIGRFLERRARSKARSAAEQLLALGGVDATVLDAGGKTRLVAPDRVEPGDLVLVAPGQRVPIDGRIEDGISDIDTGLITGETLPGRVAPGDTVFAGTLNLTGALRLRVTAVGDATLLAEIARLMEIAEQGRGRYVAIADRVSRLYAPVVHVAALLTFLGWLLILHAPWPVALLNAVAVLIITCPCALALAVPAVQIVAGGWLMRHGVLLKSATALERLARVDTVVFDKTGTLTEGRLDLVTPGIDPEALRLAAALAGTSRHPLARALCRAVPGIPVARGVEERAGLGLVLATPGGEVRLGNRRLVGVTATDGPADAAGPEMWLARPGVAALRLGFVDRLRADAGATIADLQRRGYQIALLSGDRSVAVAQVAAQLGIAVWRAEQSPADKVAFLEALRQSGRTVLMVGDGLNDAPALAAAAVSVSPSTAADVSQTAADLVFQGTRLSPVREALALASRARRRVRENFTLALVYNFLMVPAAVCGFVTPLFAALAMSTSSLVVILNALRLSPRRQSPPAPSELADVRVAVPDPGRLGLGPAGAGHVPVDP